jgi:uncharacterized protein (TIGR00661 family)
MNNAKRILIAPLDWGLGHATRCIPIIKLLTEKGMEVIIAADGRAVQLLKDEFPSLRHIHLRGYRIHYSKTFYLPLMIALQIPKMIASIVREHFQLINIIRKEQPDIVISDNRYGLWSKKVKCIFVTHQLMVKCPAGLKFLEPILHRIILWLIKKYDECWIPDVVGENNLSGDLSHRFPLPANAKFIGWLSRLHSSEIISEEKKYDLLVLLSGTEPQRTMLENILTGQILKTNFRTLMVRGITEEQKQFSHQNNLEVVSYLTGTELLSAINKSEIIICRPGYSTLMDLAATGKKAILIPTPGQTEQEYLGNILKEKKISCVQEQNNFSLNEAMKSLQYTFRIEKEKFSSQLETVIENLLV